MGDRVIEENLLAPAVPVSKRQRIQVRPSSNSNGGGARRFPVGKGGKGGKGGKWFAYIQRVKAANGGQIPPGFFKGKGKGGKGGKFRLFFKGGKGKGKYRRFHN